MDTQKQIKISIPELCHEDWNKMTPNEKGSFCSKCCKTVVDFTQKSPEEIKNILLKDSEKKVCGRFMSHQLDEPVPETINLIIPVNMLPKHVSPLRSFAIALFVVFGTTLFSCGTYNNAPLGEVQIESATLPPPNETDTLQAFPKGEVSIMPVENQTTTQDTIKKRNTKSENEIMGDVILTPVCEPIRDTIKSNTRPTQTHEKMGKIKVHKE